ncbi:MAG TPA: YciI family protein [Vicinamibacterales bacterium]
MKFMMMVKAGNAYEAGEPPAKELIDAIGQITQEMIEKGVLVDTGGLLPSRTGARIRVAGGQLTVLDGPFAETKELVGGYAILKVASRDEAVALGRRFMKLHADVLGPTYEGELEIRQLADQPGR